MKKETLRHEEESKRWEVEEKEEKKEEEEIGVLRGLITFSWCAGGPD